MINSINSQNHTVQQTRVNTGTVDNTMNKASTTTENITHNDSRKNAISFIETATSEELEARVNSLIGGMPSMATINLREIMNSDNESELLGRIGRLGDKMNQEHRNVFNQEQVIINQGRAEGKSDKDILIDIVKMKDEQSELFKMSANWGNKGLSSSENYAKLVELTPSYVNYYA